MAILEVLQRSLQFMQNKSSSDIFLQLLKVGCISVQGCHELNMSDSAHCGLAAVAWRSTSPFGKAYNVPSVLRRLETFSRAGMSLLLLVPLYIHGMIDCLVSLVAAALLFIPRTFLFCRP